MPAGAWVIYGLAKDGILKNTIGPLDNSGTPRYRMALVTSAYTPSNNVHNDWQDVSANEVVNGGGYATHGVLLTPTVTHSAGTVTFDVLDVQWTSSTITAKYAVIVRDANADNALAATDLLLCYCDLETGGGSVSTTNGTFAITIHTNGVFTLT